MDLAGRISNPVAWTRRRAEAATADWERAAAEGRQDFEAFDPRGADRHNRSPAAGLALQGLHEFCGAGPGDPLARREFPPRALAEAGRRHDDSTSAGRHQRAFRAGAAPLRAGPIPSRPN